MEPKAIAVTLAGTEYPLCLTVAALEEIETLCGAPPAPICGTCVPNTGTRQRRVLVQLCALGVF